MADIKRTCSITRQPFLITEAEQDFVERLNRAMPHLKGLIPLSNIHPVEVMRRTVAFGNYFYLFHGESAFSRRRQLTRYSPQIHPKICAPEEFWDESIDNTAFGKDYDFSRPFFPQFEEALSDSFIMALLQINAENSNYVNGAINVKNCFLCFDILESQDCLYCFLHDGGNDNLLCVSARRSQYCYDSLNIDNCYECQHCVDCINTSASFGCYDLIGCSSCFGCAGLRNVENHVFNQPLTDNNYRTFLKTLDLGDRGRRESELKRCGDFIAGLGHEKNHLINVEDSSGDYLRDCSNARQCYFSSGLKDCGYLSNSRRSSNCWRGMAIDAEYSYQSVPLGSQRELYCYGVSGGEGNIYSLYLEQNCSHCFGCTALKNKSYCILNKQYSKEDYLSMLARIIPHMIAAGEWGEPLPPRLSPHRYEHSLAHVFFEPLSAAEASRRGYQRADVVVEEASGEPCDPETLPVSIGSTEERHVVGKAFRCPASLRFFNIQKAELAFHKRFNIPLPTLHWQERINRLWRRQRLISESI